VTVALLASACLARRAPAPETVLEEVARTVEERFFDPGRAAGVRADLERVRPLLRQDPGPAGLARAGNALLAGLGASHTALLTPDDPAYFVLAELFWDALDPGRRARAFPRGAPLLTGIGLLTEEAPDDDGPGIFVRGVLEGGPAEHAGVRLGDRLLAVDGLPFHPVRSFQGRAGRTVRLRLRRARDAEALELDVVPEERRPSAFFLDALRASARVVEREGARLGYVHLWSWAGEAYQDALRELLLAGPLADADGLVLDLRGGFGGANLEYLNLFRRDLPQLTAVARDGTATALASAWTRPVVLLIDEGTTSGKEVFAHAFQRLARGPVVGTRSAGAVLGGSAFLMADGSLLYLAVLDVRVDGERLEGRGVTPEVEVPLRRPYAAGHDPQRERALEVLRRTSG